MRKVIYFLFISFFLPMFAAEEGDFVTLPREQVHEGDYFVTGGTVEISGIVIGDVYAFGSRVVIDGQIEGDVIATGGTIELSGQVGGNARLVGAQVEIRGIIERNLTVVGGNIQSDPLSVVRGNAVLTGGIIDLAGDIMGNVTLTASNGRLLGKVGKNLKAYVSQLRIGSRAEIGESLDYTSSREALIDSGARIGGKTTFHTSTLGTVFEGKWRRGIVFGSKLAGILMSFLFSFVIGWILIKLFPTKVKATIQFLEKNPWKALWVGLIIIFILPIAALILFITILGLPLALALVAISLLTFYTAKIFSVLWISNKIFPKIGLRPNTLSTLFFGLILFFLVVQIPVVGGFLSLAFTLLGLGALFLSRASRARKARKKL